ncbi:MAG TPA: addiction module protein [Pseudolabrys sp.]|jgi:putative addiction module component (TIGR02574 family)|nr:addiction module protein [Pseudolabrys sp.]
MNKAQFKELFELSEDERIELGQELLDSAHAEELPPLTAEQKAEIDRRIEEHERDPSSAIPWEEVRAWLWSRRK